MPDKNISDFSNAVLELIPHLLRATFKKHKDELSKGSITLPQFLSLDLLDNYGKLKMKEIARQLYISLPAATGMIDRLYRLGMVERKFSAKDRRVIEIALTSKGKKVLENTRHSRRKAIGDVFSHLTKKERQLYLNILRKLKGALDVYKK